MKKNKVVKLTKKGLENIIKEGVEKLHRKTLIEKRIKAINEEFENIGMDRQISHGPILDNVSLTKDSIVDLFIKFIVGKPSRSKMENALKSINFFKRYNLEDGYDLDTIEEAFYRMDERDVEAVFLKMVDGSQESLSEGRIEMSKRLSEGSEVASPMLMSILNSYLETALWSQEDDIGDADVEFDISNDSKIDAYIDIKKFIDQAGSLLDGMDPSDIGHDLWLNRNGHGAGFWDRDLGEDGDKLSDIAISMGEKHVFWDDEGKVVIE